MFGRIAGARSALQDIRQMSALQRPQRNEEQSVILLLATALKCIAKSKKPGREDRCEEGKEKLPQV